MLLVMDVVPYRDAPIIGIGRLLCRYWLIVISSDGQIPNPNLTLKSQIFKTQIRNPNPKIQISPPNPNLKTPNPNQIPIPNW